MRTEIVAILTGLALLITTGRVKAQHLWWDTQRQDNATCLYGEITVLATHHAIYYCGANWHPGEPAGGYCGIQHNGPNEHRTIFSIWDTSPQLHPSVSQADPKTIFNRFGGEGEGAHTHMLWDWKVGETFRFFVEKRPGAVPGTTDTRYYIYDRVSKKWRHSASITSPNGDKNSEASVETLGGGAMASFLENFAGTDRDVPKLALYRLWLGTDVEAMKCLTRARGDGTWGQLHDAYFLAEGGSQELGALLDNLQKQYGDPIFGQKGQYLSPISDKRIPAEVVRELKARPASESLATGGKAGAPSERPDVAAGQASIDSTPPDQLLLKDYHPRSIYKVPQTRVEKARFPVIDVHSHPYARTRAQVDRWVRNMDEVGIAKTVIMVGATGKAFDDAVALFEKYPDRFQIWCGIDFTGFDQPGFAERAIAELERCCKTGALGVGELSDKGRGLFGSRGSRETVPMHVDDPRMDPIFERCADLSLPVNIHVGEDRWMYEPMDRHNDGLMNAYQWKIPKEPGVLRHDEIIATLDRAVQKHPRTTFIACHFANCCYDLSILGRMLDAHPNLYADIGARFGETAPIPRYMARFYEKYQDRLLYGTDMGFDTEMYRTTFRILESEDEHFYAQDLFGYHWPLHGFGLKDAVLRKVYGANARKILKKNRS